MNVCAGYWEYGSREGPGVLCGILADGTMVPVVFCMCHDGNIHHHVRFEGTSALHKHIMESASIEIQKAITAARTARQLSRLMSQARSTGNAQPSAEVD